MSAASQAGMPTPLKPLDITNAEHSEAVIAAASAIRVRRNPASFAALCLIDSIQREHSALMRSLRVDEFSREQADERAREEAEDIQAGLRHQHPLG